MTKRTLTPEQREAANASQRRYKASEAGRATARRGQSRYKQRHLKKVRAHWAVQAAIRRGALVRPSKCEHCGQTSPRIEAAHTDYARQLDIEWLCPPCHRRKDAKHD